MKRIINISVVSLLVLGIISCDPIENRDELPATIKKESLQYSVSQDATNPNIINLSSSTPGVIPFWDYVVGSTNKASTSVLIPFGGDFWIKYYAYAGGVPAVDSTKITLEQDLEYFSNPAWYLLTNGPEGKTWVWAVDNPKGYGVWGIGAWNASWGEWWPGAAGVASQVKEALNDEMTFDLNKGFNYTLQQVGENPLRSKFTLDLSNMTLNLKGSGDISFGKSGVTYYIVKLTEDELTLKYEDSGNGWFYLFKRKGYVYGG